MLIPPVSMVSITLVCFVITLLMVVRFYLMIYYPGTKATRPLFDFMIPFWDSFSGLTFALRAPVESVNHYLLQPLLPASLKTWFPEMPAARIFGNAAIYPGKVEWLNLLTVPFWCLTLCLFQAAVSIMLNSRDEAMAELKAQEVPEEAAPPKKSGTADKLKPRSRVDKYKAPAEENAPAIGSPEGASKTKDRLSQFRPGEGDLPKITRDPQYVQESMDEFRDREGKIMVNHMIRSLQRENQTLQTQQQSLKSTFSQYFSPNVIQYLEQNKDLFANVANQKRDVSILFCDIRGFSAYSQTASSDELVTYLGEYFSIASEIILHRYDGTINKLMGDGLMAYWGFPLPQQDHAFIATTAALHILKEVDLRNRTTPGAKPLDIGIGVASGEAIVGNIGSTDFKDFTLVGVPVNLASRLDNANKQHRTQLLISENTHRGLQGRLRCRDLGQIDIPGWQGAERVYAPELDFSNLY